jgi:hypothetical protein
LCKFFLALPGFEEKIMKSLDQLSYTLAGYPVSGLTGYKKMQDYPAGYPVHPYF